MAQFYLRDFVSYNNVSDVVATTWQISLDPEFKKVVDDTVFDTENILSWRSELKIFGERSSLGYDIPLYVRVKIYTNNGSETFESDWFTAKEKPHKDNEEVLTRKGIPIARIKINGDGTYETII